MLLDTGPLPIFSTTCSSMVYTARVVGARCNCANGTTLSCVRYTQLTELSAEVVAMGECDGASFVGFDSIGTCASLNRALSGSTGLLNNTCVFARVHALIMNILYPLV